MFLDIITTLWQAFWGFFTGICTLIWDMLPEIMQLRQIAAYLSPTGVIALWLGVPVFVVTVAKFIIKRLVKA